MPITRFRHLSGFDSNFFCLLRRCGSNIKFYMVEKEVRGRRIINCTVLYFPVPSPFFPVAQFSYGLGASFTSWGQK